MSSRRRLVSALAGVLLALDMAWAATAGVTPAGWAYVEGGPAPQDELVLQARRAQYNLLVMSAGRVSAEPVLNMRVRVSADGGRPAFTRVLSGPWLLLNLPAGRYEVEASARGQVQRQPVAIVLGEPVALVFYVDDAAVPPAD
ncbi:hypothetical protein [Azohydromonas caseinilytica]|uniref:Carboxypeptidase regulatory-like domain-containing protein n=1 Tax=Azohydromonas caseinilytica TaxID=2728836 RepID=A0A848FHD3_9BURK|nr:hypothetical protein [Azohydromonas caseinilytica]NML17663.1 hypothetical protein [Azohydromonas caseinilytica]